MTHPTPRARALAAFLDQHTLSDAIREPMEGDASSRRYERLRRDAARWIVMDDPSETLASFRAFQHIAALLAQKNLSPPNILAVEDTHGFMLLEDLGNAIYAREIERDPTLETPLYFAAIDLFSTLHQTPLPDGIPAYGPAEMTEASGLAFLWYQPELQAKWSSDAQGALDQLHALLTLETAPPVLTLRDYHAENLIWLPDREGHARVGLLDFQDAAAAHPIYDLISLTRDARRDVSSTLAQACLERYATNTEQDVEVLSASAALIAVQRNLRILGVFARLSRQYRKPHYVDLIPRVWHMLLEDLEHPVLHGLRDAILPLLPAPEPTFLHELKKPCPA